MGKKLGLGCKFHFDRDFKTIVFTGGPCAGKSEAIEEMGNRLFAEGYKVYSVREVATDIYKTGFRIDPENDLSSTDFQAFKVEFSLARENCFVRAAKNSVAKKKVILLDRGIMDDLVYAGDQLFDEILRSHGLSRMDARDRRYDAIFHLRTVAVLGDEFYEAVNKNNPARKENPEEARQRDCKTAEAWIGHRHLRIIPAFANKEEKFDLLWRHIKRVIGIPKFLEIERKFLVQASRVRIPTPSTTVSVIQNYLIRGQDGISPRIRLVSDFGFPSTAMFYKTLKKKISGLSREEKESILNCSAYELLHDSIDRFTKTIKKLRTYFVYENQYFELDEFITPYDNLVLLEIELLEEGDEIILPSFIKVIKEVTDDPNYSNSHIAKMSLGRKIHP